MAEESQDFVQEFLQECAAERDQVQKQLQEVEMMIRSSSAEVEKFSRRNAELANRMRQLESNFDTVPREDLRNIYAAQQKEQGRLFIIQGQVERQSPQSVPTACQ